MKRRDFIAITGAGAVAAVAPEIGYKAFWSLWGEGDWQRVPKGVEKYVPTICQQCPGGCGVLIRKIGERAVKIEANPSHPVSRHGLCPKGMASLQVLYHPARIRTPLKRVGPRGSGQWQSISWDEAIETVARALRDIRERDEPHTVAFLDGEESNGLMRTLIKRFLEAYGSPNYIAKTSSVMDEHLMKSVPLDDREGFYDLGRAKYVLSFGFNFIETFYSPLPAIQAYSKLRVKKAKMVYVGSRLSVTGIKSDEWIPVNPGSEGLLAIGLAQTIIRENLYNMNYIIGRTSKFEDYREAVFKRSLGEISEKTGVEEDTIEELAREFAAEKELAVAIGNSGTLADQAAINSLNILTGSIEALWWDYDEKAIPYAAPPEIRQDSTAARGASQVALLAPDLGRYPLAKEVFGIMPGRILSEEPYPVKLLFIYYSNPLLSVPNAQKMRKALEKVPFIVNFSPFMDETAEISDLILPDHSPLEKWQDAPQHLLDGTPILGLRQPIVKNRHDTIQTGEALIKIAQKYGEPLSSAFPWKDFKEYLIYSLKGLYDSKKGGIYSGEKPASYEDWLKVLIQSAWWYPAGKKIFARKAEFNPELIEKIGESQLGKSKEYPFHLNVYKLMTLAKPRNTVQPTLFDIAAPHIYRKWVAWVEINPETAHELGIQDEDWVWIESPIGREKFKAKLYPGTKPEAVNIPLIIGSKGYGRWTKDNPEGGGHNAFNIVPDLLDPMDGHYIYTSRVKIYKA